MKKTTRKTYQREKKGLALSWIMQTTFIANLILFTGLGANAQSGGWDSYAETGGATGYTDHGNGVIQLLNTASTGCSATALHETTDTYDPTVDGVFNKCYEVFFGCPGNDQINSDQKGDGMAFSFWRNSATYNINNGLACGGGLGYMGTPSDGRMITIEFDTWSSEGNVNFDNAYEGSGNTDQIAIHRDGVANFTGKVTGVDPGNLEDGLEHTVCISYDPSTDIFAVTIDGNTVLSYDATGTGIELETYFGAGGLNQTWSSGKFGATNPTTVSDGADISDNVGGPLCPAGVFITSPSDGAVFGSCDGPVNITAAVTPPAGNTVSSVEFFIDGMSIGSDASAPYAITWNTPTNGNHVITAQANYTPSGTNDVSAGVNITIGGGLQVTSTPPTIDGTIDPIWGSYATIPLTQGYNNPPDLAATYQIMYDATNLYILVDVTDEDLRNDSGNDWEDDGVEIFIDIGNDKSGAYGANDYQYGLKYNDPTAAEYKHAPGSLSGVTMAQGAKAGGYIMEVSIPWATLGGTPTPGTYLGFDVKLNDDDGGGGRDNELAWNDGSFGAWNNTSLFGTLQFSSCDPQPVELLSFTGRLENSVVVLDWTTVVEINNEKFIIERSTNLTDWEAIGEVAGAGNASVMIDYSFIDHTPPNGTVYYRLHQIDFDGSDAYSNVVVINTKTNYLSITPNPFVDTFTINTNSSGSMDVFIHDVFGRLLFQAKYEANGEAIQVQPDLPSGAYLVTIKGEGFVAQEKLVKR